MVLVTTLVGYLIGDKESLILPAKITTTIAGALLGLLGIWAYYTWILIKNNSKEEKIKRAREAGRFICDCTETGEIMLLEDYTNVPLIYRCPNCGCPKIVRKEY